jgi:hypothetical protein
MKGGREGRTEGGREGRIEGQRGRAVERKRFALQVLTSRNLQERLPLPILKLRHRSAG